MPRQVYKIQFDDGTFSDGSRAPHKVTEGKDWPTLERVSSHLAKVTSEWARTNGQSKGELSDHPYQSAQLVTCALTVTVILTEPVSLARPTDQLIQRLKAKIAASTGTPATRSGRRVQHLINRLASWRTTIPG